MKGSFKTGLSFGLSSGVITTLGLMIGLNTSTGSRLVVIGGILTIAIADAFSDALGIHMSEESNKKKKHKEIWESTFATFFTKFIIACTFLVPLLITSLKNAIKINVAWGFFLLVLFNYLLAKERKESPTRAIINHVGIAIAVIIITYYVGKFIAFYFG